MEFNAILHARNNRRVVTGFFLERFGKSPHIASLSKMDVRKEKKTTFDSMRRVQTEVIPPVGVASEKPKATEKETPSVTDVFNARGVIFSQTGYIIRKYAQLLENLERKVIVSTGTCAPFAKKIFVTVNGKFLPCERVPQYFSLGMVNETGVHLDYENIAKKYNDWYGKLGKMCNNCYACHYCSQCILFLNLNDGNVVCDRFKNKSDYSNHLAGIISKIETSPATYLRVFTGKGANDISGGTIPDVSPKKNSS